MKTITLGNKVMVSDPCYGMNTWCQGVVENVMPGIYNCTVEYSDEGDWGVRVSAIEVMHQNARMYFMDAADFEVGVDSGQAGIFDYEYYAKHHLDRSVRPHVDDDWYERVCDITLAKESAGTIDDSGLVSSSGYGDGGYTCYLAKNGDGCVVGLRVVYIYEDEYEEEYDEYEDYDVEDDEEEEY